MEYQHGGDIYSQRIEMDYSASLNPLGIPEGVKNAVRMAAETCSCYPDSESRALTRALAEFWQVPEGRVICGNGAADLIFSLVLALKPVRAVVPVPTFSEYAQALRSVGCRIERFTMEEKEGFALDTDKFCRFLEKNGETLQMAFLCNPNNPTGLTVPCKEIERIVQICEDRGILLVVDECFCEFLENSGEVSAVPLLERYRSLFILKAFTKIYAMAGLRLGYGLSRNETLLERVKQVRQPWPVSTVAQEAGTAALKEEDYVARRRHLEGEARCFLKQGLESLGFFVWDSQANYLFFKDTRRVPERELYLKLLEKGILIRSCANYSGLSGRYYRICVKTREENQKLLEAVRQCCIIVPHKEEL